MRFDHTNEELQKLTESIVEKGTKMLNSIVAIKPEDKTYKNTVLPLGIFESEFSTMNHIIGLYKSASPDKAKVEKSLELIKVLEEFGHK